MMTGASGAALSTGGLLCEACNRVVSVVGKAWVDGGLQTLFPLWRVNYRHCRLLSQHYLQYERYNMLAVCTTLCSELASWHFASCHEFALFC